VTSRGSDNRRAFTEKNSTKNYYFRAKLLGIEVYHTLIIIDLITC